MCISLIYEEIAVTCSTGNISVKSYLGHILKRDYSTSKIYGGANPNNWNYSIYCELDLNFNSDRIHFDKKVNCCHITSMDDSAGVEKIIRD